MSNLTRIMVVSGFLGSGKTTSMYTLAKYINSNMGKAHIIVNDLGANLVDTKYSLKMYPEVTEIPSGCICYQMDNFVDKINRIIKNENPNLIMSDIPGCGVGALDHVYHTLNNNYKGEYLLAPFTVIVDPERLQILIDEKNSEKIHINKELKYLMIKQLEEADIIVLNKIDLLNNNEINEYIQFLKKLYPYTEVIPISAKMNKNIDVLAKYILNNNSSLKKISLDMEKFTIAENLLSWYNRRISLFSDKKIEINRYVEKLMDTIRDLIMKENGNTLHFKIFANNLPDDGEYLKASLIGIDHNIEFDHKISNPNNKISLIINMRSILPSNKLSLIVDNAIDSLSKKYNINPITKFLESFGIMD